MSFQFNWPDFDPTFYAEAIQQLETALNKEKKSKHIADYIFVKELNMGSKPPELEILEICELSTDYFRGIFKLTYCGDAFIELKTKIQANPLHSSSSPHYENHYCRPLLSRHNRPSMVAAAQPLVIPMLLRISDVQLNGIIVLSVSKTKGITLVFKNDALTHLQVSSTFDIVSSIKSYLQQQIESQLRTFLQDLFPLVVHEYSLRHINDQQQRTQPSVPPNVSLSSPSLQLRQKSNSSDNTTHFCDSPISSSTTNTIPDLTSSSSDCISDTSSECMSYDDVDMSNNILVNTPSPSTTGFDQLKDDNSISPNTTTASHCPTSFYTKNIYLPYINTITAPTMYNRDAHPFSTIHHYYDSSFTSSTPLQKTEPFILQKQPSCVYQQEDGGNTNTGDQQTHYLDDGIPPTRALFFDQPVVISTNASHNGLIQRMADISASSQTLTIDTDSNRTFVIHKTTTTMADITHVHHPRKKIPKRRIIKWNA